jgi:hypothetical protein
MTDAQLLDAIRTRIADPASHVDARTTQRLQVYAPASDAALAKAERALGFALPPLLRALYSEIANGGFGPGYGLVGVEGGYTDDGKTIVDLYNEIRSYGWPERLLLLWNWGCAVWSCLDAKSPEGSIITQSEGSVLMETPYTLHSWLEAWVTGANLWDELFETELATVINPFTKRPAQTKRTVRAKGKPFA